MDEDVGKMPNCSVIEHSYILIDCFCISLANGYV